MRDLATLFKEIGFDQPTAVGIIVSGTNFLFTLFALKYIDIIGRRKIMVWTSPGMVVGLVLASVAFHCASPPVPGPSPGPSVTRTNNPRPICLGARQS